MAKKKSLEKLTRKDLVGISKFAKLSISTVIKWYDGSLNVKPETEQRIFEAVNLHFQEETLRITERLDKLTEVEQRIAETKAAMKEALKITMAIHGRGKGRSTKLSKK